MPNNLPATNVIRGSHTTLENENFSENEELLRILRSQVGDVIHGSAETPLWGRFWHGERISKKVFIEFADCTSIEVGNHKKS